MSPEDIQFLKSALVHISGLSRDTLHVYVGLIVFFSVALMGSRNLQSPGPWLAAVAAAVMGEVVDAMYQLDRRGHWDWVESLHDIFNTSFWPTALFVLACRTGVFTRAGDQAALSTRSNL